MNKIVVVDGNSQIIERSLLKRGLFDFLLCQTANECVDICKRCYSDVQNITIFAHDNRIDSLVEELKSSDDVLSLINEQAVKIERQTTVKNITLIPYEGDFEKLLDDCIEKNEVFVSAVFGKTESFLQQKFEEIKNANREFRYKIITKTPLLHIVYHSQAVPDEVFEGSLFARSDVSISEAVKGFLKDRSVAIAENVTGGLLTAKMLGSCKENIKSSFPIFSERDFEKIGIDKLYLDQNGSVGKETAFDMAKNMLRTENTDLAIAVTGFDCDAGRSYVAVGNKEKIYVFSSVFYGDRKEIVENISDFAIFKAYLFLKENY